MENQTKILLTTKKKENPGHWVVCSVNCHASSLLKSVYCHLQPIVKEITYVKDTKDFLKIPEDSVLVKSDVKYLHVNIPKSEGMKAFMEAYNERTNKLFH